MNLIALRNRALEIAIGELGVRETLPNRGPRISRYQQAAGIAQGQPWCAAFLVWCYQQAAEQLGMASPLPRTGKVVRLWRRSPDLWKGGYPTVGAIYCHVTNPSDPESPGHCGIVVRPFDSGIQGIEGNTDDAGSREGDTIAMRKRLPSYVNLGYLDMGREGPSEEPRIV